jgi:hypothetical protein
MRRIVLSALTIACASAGCMTVAPVAGPALARTGFSFAAGRASQDFAYSTSALLSSVRGALEDLRIQSIKEKHDAGTVVYEGTTTDDRRATVMLRPGQDTTRVSIRIGWFGDEPLSKALMDRIGIRLGTLPPSAIPIDPPSAPASNPYFSRSAISDETMLRDQADAVYRDTPVP